MFETPAVGEAYLADPLVAKEFSVALLRAVHEGHDWLRANAAAFADPVILLLHGGDDGLVSPQDSIDFFEEISSTDKSLRIYAGLYHEIFNEFKRDQVIRDAIESLDGGESWRTSAPASANGMRRRTGPRSEAPSSCARPCMRTAVRMEPARGHRVRPLARGTAEAPCSTRLATSVAVSTGSRQPRVFRSEPARSPDDSPCRLAWAAQPAAEKFNEKL